jgi:hypothetical protein
LQNGKRDKALDLLAELKRRARPFDTPAQDEIFRLQELLQQSTAPSHP